MKDPCFDQKRSSFLKWLWFVLPVALLAAGLANLFIQCFPSPQGAAGFDIREEMIPMRDGVRLHTKICIPRNQEEPFPFLMVRTPYGIEGLVNRLKNGGKQGPYRELVEDGYIFVFQDIRGRFGSEGAFVMLRPARDPGDSEAVDEGTDTYDTIEWLLKNIPRHNGRIGQFGVSYGGWTTVMATLEPHPALRAVSPQASPADMWLGDDFHHNGAFRLSYGFEYAVRMESPPGFKRFSFDRYDTFDWYLRLGPLSNVNAKYLQGKIPTWNDFVAHPDYDEFWKRQTMIPRIKAVKMPTLNVAGWWDQEDFYGPLRIYEEFEKYDGEGTNWLVVGPWNHGGWSWGEGRRLGDVDFGSATSLYFREKIEAPWFAYWLKGEGKLEMPEALTFEAGTNRWRSWEAWPPRHKTEEKDLYFHGEGKIAFDPPAEAGNEACDVYLSDPAHPVPYRHRPIEATYFHGGSRWPTWLVEDQRFVNDRPDVLSWESPPLEQGLTIAGEIVARLFASTSGSDSDWIVKLIDVYPEDYPQDWKMAGFELMVANEVFRGRYRNSFEKPEPVLPDEVILYEFSLHTQNYTFKKGHRIMVQVQSTWFPLIDRNPQTFVPNIFEAEDSDFKRAEQRIWRSKEFPSRLTVPVIKKLP